MELNELYTDVINEYSHDRTHRHPLEHADVTMRGVNPSCGDELSLSLEIADGKIKKAAIEGSGCAISEASAAIMTDMMEGKPLEEARRLAELFLGMVRKTVTDDKTLEELEDALAFRNISNMPARTKCAVLAWHTLEEALLKWQAEVQQGAAVNKEG